MKVSNFVLFGIVSSNIQVGLSFLNPAVGRIYTYPLYFFGNKKSKEEPPAAPKRNTKTKGKIEAPVSKKDELNQGQKLLRIAVTGSLDGVSLLGKPQHDWNEGYTKKNTMSPDEYRGTGKRSLRKQNWLN